MHPDPIFKPFPSAEEDTLFASTYWRVIVNRNQARLGNLLIVLRRHCTAVRELLPAEMHDLHQQMIVCEDLLKQSFAPDHVNFNFQMNRRRHVHLHVIPRYFNRSPEFEGLHFADHPDILSRRMPPTVHRAIVEKLRQHLATPDDH